MKPFIAITEQALSATYTRLKVTEKIREFPSQLLCVVGMNAQSIIIGMEITHPRLFGDSLLIYYGFVIRIVQIQHYSMITPFVLEYYCLYPMLCVWRRMVN